jgi:hypothetical protein
MVPQLAMIPKAITVRKLDSLKVGQARVGLECYSQLLNPFSTDRVARNTVSVDINVGVWTRIAGKGVRTFL